MLQIKAKPTKKIQLKIAKARKLYIVSCICEKYVQQKIPRKLALKETLNRKLFERTG